jgi:choline dehydrogenase-like flavoprotein
MRAGLQALGLSGEKIHRYVKGCRGSSHCNQGCPTDQKQSMSVTFIPRALAAGARLYATCRADRVLAGHGRAASVTGRFVDRRTGRRGPRLRVHARKAVIVAASAVQTPLLLAASGIGRASGLVGRRFQAHPGTAVVGVFDRAVDMWFGATQAYECMHYWDEGMKFETVSMPLELASSRLPGMGAPLVRELAAFGHMALWGVSIRARAHGRVKRGPFGGAAISYDLTDDDVRKLKLGVKRLVQMMFAAGAREVLPGVYGLPDRISKVDEIEPIFDLPDDPRILHFIASHLFGTACMGKDPRAAVVGPELESHEMPGLYVLDSSVFPTNIGVNPQHTISAVAWLGAERIAERARG